MKLHVRDFIPFVIPALLDAGWSTRKVRWVMAETGRRMDGEGGGGPTEKWLRTLGDVVAEQGDERAAEAFLAAFDRWTALLN